MAGEFVSNPLVASIGAHLGLSDLLGSGTEAATQTAVPTQITPPKSGATMAPMRNERLQENLSRPKTVARAASTRGSQPGVAPNMPGVMSPDVLMHPAVQQLLGQFGITPEQLHGTVQNASPDLFITNPAAHANHPVLSGMVERALEGLAFTHGGNTVGESLSNIAQGMLTAQQARAEKYNNQLMMPFAQAQQVANLQGTSLHQQYEDAEAKRANAQAEMYNQMPEYRQGLLDIRNRQADDKVSNQRAMNHLKLQLMPEFSQLTPEHAQQFSADLQKAGGDIGNLTDEQMEQYRQMGHSDGLAAQTQSKIKVKGAPSGVTGGRGRGGAVDHTGDKADLSESQRLESQAARDLQAFDTNIGKGTLRGDDGKILIAGSQAAQARRQQLEESLRQARQGSQGVIQRMRGLRVPGSGMTNQGKGGARPAPVGYRDPASGLTKQADGTWK